MLFPLQKGLIMGTFHLEKQTMGNDDYVQIGFTPPPPSSRPRFVVMLWMFSGDKKH